jgi:hypothetical protein
VFGQDDTAAAALVATLSGKDGSAAGPSAAAVAAYAQAHGGSHAASGPGAEVNAAAGAEDSGTSATAAGGASASAAAQAKAIGGGGAARRQQTKAELEEQARQEELEGLRAEVQQYSSNGTCPPLVVVVSASCSVMPHTKDVVVTQLMVRVLHQLCLRRPWLCIVEPTSLLCLRHPSLRTFYAN